MQPEYQSCPRCGGSGQIPNPYISTTTGPLTVNCNVCNRAGIIQRPVEPRLPLKELVNDYQMCGLIAQLVGLKEWEYAEPIIKFKAPGAMMYIDLHSDRIAFYTPSGQSSIPNWLKLADLLLSKYKI